MVYRFLSHEQLYVAARINTATGEIVGAPGNVGVQRNQLGGGLFITRNLLAKVEWVNQNYNRFPGNNILNGGNFPRSDVRRERSGSEPVLKPRRAQCWKFEADRRRSTSSAIQNAAYANWVRDTPVPNGNQMPGMPSIDSSDANSPIDASTTHITASHASRPRARIPATMTPIISAANIRRTTRSVR